MNDQHRIETAADNCEVLRARLARYEDAEGVPLAKPVWWQFYQDGEWHNGYKNVPNHRANTEAAGYQTRDLYAGSAPSHGEQVRHMVPEGFRVMKPTSSVVRYGDRWEIYAPCGSGGVVNEDDVTDWVVRQLLDAMAAPSAGSQEQE